MTIGPLIQLTINMRVIALSVIFLIPLFILIFLFSIERNYEIASARNEIEGARHIRAIHSLLIQSLRTPDAKVEQTRKIARDLGSAGDRFGIELDPDEESYYLGRAVSTRLPALLIRCAELEALVRQSASNNTPAAGTVELAIAVDRLKNAAEAFAESVGMAVDASGGSSARFDISNPAASVTKAVATLASAANTSDLHELDGARDELLAAADSFFSVGEQRLENLLETRIESIQTLIERRLSVILLLVAIGGIFAFTMAQSIIRPVRAMTRALSKLAGGDFSVEVPARTRLDEIGEMAEAAHVFKLALIESERLRAQQKESQAMLRTARNSLQTIMDNATDGLVMLDARGVILSVSAPAQRLFGYEAGELIGRPITELYIESSGDREIGAPLADSSHDWRVALQRHHEFEARRKDGSGFPIELFVNEIAIETTDRQFVLTVRDISERKRSEARILQAQKMEAVGLLAGGVAHEFNNMIGAILGFAGFLTEDLEKGSPQYRFAERIGQTARRARELVKQILIFSRPSKMERIRADLSALLIQAVELARAALPQSTELTLTAEEQGLIADIDEAQLSQAILNLCLNASDSLDGRAGRLFVSLSPARKSELESAASQDVGSSSTRIRKTAPVSTITVGSVDPSRHYAKLTVRDTGTGMNEDVMNRIFEPFFSTKEFGRGTGLGLSVVHGVIVAHEGMCRVTSRFGEGTEFEIFLPLSEAHAMTAAA